MHQLKVKNIIPQPNNNVTIIFEDVHKKYPVPLPGQFLTLIFDLDGREVRRSYSFNNCSPCGEELSITVKRIDNGEISRLLHHRLEVGEILNVLTPQGKFTYDSQTNSAKNIVLFAAGVGITPLFSILKAILYETEDTQIVLLYSNSSTQNTLFYDELKAFEEKFAERFTIIWLFSTSKNLLKARLNRDLIRDVMYDFSRDEIKKNTLIYTCGPVIYMDLCKFTLLGMGFSENQILRETFQLPENEEDEDDDTIKIVDTNTYSIELIFEGKKHAFDVPYNKSILDIALEEGLRIPYSCNSGMCSTCTSQCIQGNVRMVYNEVLTDNEVANGRCLLCTGHPTENGTIIEVL